MLARNNTGSIFVEDVGEFLTANNIRATANVAFMVIAGWPYYMFNIFEKTRLFNVESRYKPVKKLISVI